MKQAIKNFLIFCFVFSGISTLLGAGMVVYMVYYYSQDLPDYHQLEHYAPPTVTRFYAYDGKLLEEYAKERRFYIGIDAIPQQVIRAFIAAEDQNFYDHPGVDFISVARAIVQNVVHMGQGKSLVGGSTITQQVVKNFLLTNERSLSRKVREAILSFRITNVFSKDKILELYLNQIYLGMGAHGVVAAAQTYFDKSLESLTLPEIALLAAMPKAPSNYDPRTNLKRAQERRNWVLRRMEEENFINHAMAQEAMASEVILRKRAREQLVKADFFAEAVRQSVVEQFGQQALYEGGLTVRTTLDPTLQAYADAAFRKGLVDYDRRKGYRGPLAHIDNVTLWLEELQKFSKPQALGDWPVGVVTNVYADKASVGLENGEKITLLKQDLLWTKPGLSSVKDVLRAGDVVAMEKLDKQKYGLRQIPQVNGAMVVMQPKTGKVLALVGGFYFGDSQFNRAMQAMRQTGSTFKTFVYLAALENGLPPNMQIEDGPVAIEQGPGLPLWRPKNFKGDFLGLITMRKGLEQSRNLVTIRLGQMVDIRKVQEITRRFGISANPPGNPAMVLGTTEASVMDMTHAYSMIANGGVRTQVSLIERVQDREGKTLFRRDTRKCSLCQVISLSAGPNEPVIEDQLEHVTDPRSAYQIISMLQGVVKRGTARRSESLGHHIAAKTGTTNGPNESTLDTWFMGFTPDLMVGVYVGYDAPRDMGKKESGATVAQPIFINFMEQALKKMPDKPFPIPSGLVFLPVDEWSGARANPTSRQVIWETFKDGTEPQEAIATEPSPEEAAAIAVENQGTGESPEAQPEPEPRHVLPPVGTGGLY